MLIYRIYLFCALAVAVELLLLAIFLRTSIFFGKVDSFSNIAASNGGNVAVMNASNEKKLKRMRMRKKKKKKTSQKSCSFLTAMENRTMKRRKMKKKTKSLKPCYSGTTILLPAVL